MEYFSLEEEDGHDLFLTQNSSSQGIVAENSGNSSILGDPNDFASPCVSIIGNKKSVQGQYSDISDDEFMDIPSSQPNKDYTGDYGRWVDYAIKF